MTGISSAIVGMKMPARVISATDFKAKCLALLDEMEQRGEPITITRRGIPVATLGPPKKPLWKSPLDSWAGRAEIIGDIVHADTTELWDALSEE
jgi:prevent-host-death family protein